MGDSSSPSGRGLEVLGIGLVVEEIGKGARLVFRYPASPPPSLLSPRPRQPRSGAAKTGNKSDKGSDPSQPSVNGVNDPESSVNLFFDLSSKVLSKLFRPKRPLCGQPLTLNVSDTIFCCRAELFDSHSSDDDHPLVLFSLIVALAPAAASSPQDLKEHRPVQGVLAEDNRAKDSAQPRTDSAYNAIRCVHNNLARLCRVLIREELRCNYLSLQVQMLLEIRANYEKIFGPDGTTTARRVGAGAPTAKSTEAKGPPPLSPVPTDSSRSVQQSSSKAAKVDSENVKEMSKLQRIEYVQNLIESMLAASPPNDCVGEDPGDTSNQQQEKQQPSHEHGNIARELAQVFRCLSRRDNGSLFSRAKGHQDGVVYINRHIAVPLASVELAQETTEEDKAIRTKPFHTLLFVSQTPPTELLKGLVDDVSTSSLSSSAAILKRILPNIKPGLTLHQAAAESCVPLPYVMDVANWLLDNRICVSTVPVVRENSYACTEEIVRKMSEHTLSFWQTFGNIDIDDSDIPGNMFEVVSMLSNSKNLGEALDRYNVDSQDLVYSMAVWLVANGLIRRVERFLFALDEKENNNFTSSKSSEELVYEELLGDQCLNGAISVSTICYEIGIEPILFEKWIQWAERTNRIVVVTRCPCQSDIV